MIEQISSQLAEEAPLGEVDYLELVDAESLDRIDAVEDRPALVAGAVFFGKTRLIDNIEIPPSSA